MRKLFRSTVAAVSTISFLAAGFYGCSSSSPTTITPVNASDAAPIDDATPASDASTSDAGALTDGGTKKDASPVVIPACIGTGAAADRSSNSIYAQVTVGASPNAQPAAFLVDFGSTSSTIDLGAFKTPPPSSCDEAWARRARSRTSTSSGAGDR